MHQWRVGLHFTTFTFSEFHTCMQCFYILKFLMAVFLNMAGLRFRLLIPDFHTCMQYFYTLMAVFLNRCKVIFLCFSQPWMPHIYYENKSEGLGFLPDLMLEGIIKDKYFPFFPCPCFISNSYFTTFWYN